MDTAPGEIHHLALQAGKTLFVLVLKAPGWRFAVWYPAEALRSWLEDRPRVTDAVRSMECERQQALESKNLSLYRMYRNGVNVARKGFRSPATGRESATSTKTIHVSGGRSEGTTVNFEKLSSYFQSLANTICGGNMRERPSTILPFSDGRQDTTGA